MEAAPIADAGFEARTIRAFRTALQRWAQQPLRDLPWRGLDDPYRVWVSEIMLQQTTVAAVIPYFQRFLARFPTVTDLASAPEADVLRLWEGLGYYSRARNLQRAAQQIVGDLQGQLPDTVEGWQALPGIGRYTAGAICSFALGLPAPIVEANTLRLYSRLLGYEGDPRSTAGQRLLWDFAERLVPETAPGPFNQALMDLGAKVCTPTDPQCSCCPVARFCRAYSCGQQHQIPRQASRPEITPVTELSIALQQGERYWLLHRQPGERWAGLWDFPRFELPRELLDHPRRQPAWLRDQVAERMGTSITNPEFLSEIKHSVTRYRITLRCYRGEIADSATEVVPTCPGRWATIEEFSGIPLSVTGRKLAELLTADQQPRSAGKLF